MMKYLKRIAETDENHATIVLVTALVALTVKIVLSASTLGTNDIAFWAFYTNYISNMDSVSVYRAISTYNHPPLVSGYLCFLGTLVGEDSNLFPFLIRLPSILADFGSVWLVWRLTTEYFADHRALWTTLIFALSPALILVSGFHGNSDPVFLFLILCSLYLFVIKRNHFAAGLLLGLAVNIKIVPLMVVPAFFFLIRPTAERVRFFGAMALVLLAGYSYHLASGFQPLITNVFFYQGLPGIWGVGKIFAGYTTYGRFVMEVVIILMMATLGWRMEGVDEDRERGRKLLEAYSVTFLAALVLSPGFGVQYLTWLVPVFCFVSPLAALAYSLASGAFLLIVYHYWSGGFPLYYANSFLRGQWRGFASDYDSALWLFLCVVFVVYSFRLYRLPGQGPESPRNADTTGSV